MQIALGFVLALSLAFAPLASATPVPAPLAPAAAAAAAQAQPSYEPYTDEQLDNLLAPIALYPDPLLAQVLVAATFPDQIDDATRWVRSYGPNGVDGQPWDVSVRAVAHYPSVLFMMDDNLDWTTAVGQAYVYQSTDVMASVQRLRLMARQQGNLVTTPQQQVVFQGGYIYIWPASPLYLYVPVYDPSIVFFRPVYFGGIFTAFSFGPALTIGVWLNLDCDWGRRRVYYTGWRGTGWIARSRPHIRINSIYVNSRFSNIAVNRAVIRRQVNFDGLSRYRSVHRNVNFRNRSRTQRAPAQPQTRRVPNKMIDRNINTNRSFEPFRGRQRPTPAPPARQRTREPMPTPTPQRRTGQPGTQSQARRPTPAPGERAPAARRAPPVQPAPGAFGRGNGSFDPRAASQRGRQSREQMNRRPAARPAPRSGQRPAPKSQTRSERPSGR